MPDIVSSGVVEEHLLNVSDHLPVFVKINNTNDQPSRRDGQDNINNDNVGNLRIPWQKFTEKQLNDYRELTESAMLATNIEDNEIRDLNSLNNANKNITTVLLECGKKMLRPKQRKRQNLKHSPKPFWSHELSELIKEKKRSFKIWVEAGRPRQEDNPIFIAHKNSKKVFTKSMRVQRLNLMLNRK